MAASLVDSRFNYPVPFATRETSLFTICNIIPFVGSLRQCETTWYIYICVSCRLLVFLSLVPSRSCLSSSVRMAYCPPVVFVGRVFAFPSVSGVLLISFIPVCY